MLLLFLELASIKGLCRPFPQELAGGQWKDKTTGSFSVVVL